jgi:acetoin utilization deacetylase AcuC-like enzyme
MILYDQALTMVHRDYGIMLPISPAREEKILEFLGRNFVAGTRGATMPFPGPVFDIKAALAYLREPAGPVVTRRDIEKVHDRAFTAALYGEGLEKALLNAYELIDSQGRPHRYEPEHAVKPLSGLFETIAAQAGGSYLACRLALAEGPGFCYYLGGGMHHARYDSGSGFCLINDVAIAALKILAEKPGDFLIWIVDLDAHKGDGTAELVRLARKRGECAVPVAVSAPAPCILTLSVHMTKGWPLDAENLAQAEPGRAPFVPSDVDIGVDSGEEPEYVPRLEAGLRQMETLSLAYRRNSLPDLIIVVDGADPYEHDGLPSTGLLKLSLEQCLARDNLVYRYAVERNIPSAWIMAGGYGERAWEPPAHFLGGVR